MLIPEFKSDKDVVSFAIRSTLPDWQKKLFERYADAVRVHSNGLIFCKINTLFPNEQEGSKDHRILAFESITEPSFCRAANNINRIFKNSSYNVEAADKTIDYISLNLHEGKNFYNWFLDEWITWALKEDANSRIVVFPPEYVLEGNPACEFVDSEFIRYLGKDGILYVSERESVVTHDLQEKTIVTEKFYDQSINGVNFKDVQKNTFTPRVTTSIKRYVYHLFVRGKGFYRIEQLEKQGAKGEDYQVDFYSFKGDHLPVIDSGGEKGKFDVNKSFLQPFVPFGNLALLQHSQHTAVNFMYSFPRMSEVATPCDDPTCDEGFIMCETDEDKKMFGDKKPCKACGGSGYKTNQTPYKVYRKKYDTQGTPDEMKYLEIPDVQFYTPPTAILDYSKNEWQSYLEKAETAVYIQQRIRTGNVEAAKSKEIDREDLYAFLSRVGQCYFSRLKFVIQSMQNYLYPGKKSEVSVAVPYSYAIMSESEAYDALKDILTSSLPIPLRASSVEGFINKFISQASPVRKFIEVLRIADPLFYYTNNEISSFKSSNVVSEEQLSNHVYSYPILQKLYHENKDLFLLDVPKIVSKLQAELKKIAPKPINDIKTAIMGQVEKTDNQDKGDEIAQDDNAVITIDRIPLALQQLSLALQRANEIGNNALGKKIQEKMNLLLSQLVQ